MIQPGGLDLDSGYTAANQLTVAEVMSSVRCGRQSGRNKPTNNSAVLTQLVWTHLENFRSCVNYYEFHINFINGDLLYMYWLTIFLSSFSYIDDITVSWHLKLTHWLSCCVLLNTDILSPKQWLLLMVIPGITRRRPWMLSMIIELAVF